MERDEWHKLGLGEVEQSPSVGTGAAERGDRSNSAKH